MDKDISLNRSFDNQFNNIKAILVFLVVLGHLTELFKEFHPIFKTTSIIIYSFHMPLFVFITGYFSKNVDKAREKASRILVAYVLYEVGMSLLSGNVMVNLFQPQTAAWYLLCTFFWRLLLKDVKKIRWGIPLSIALGLYIGFFDNIGSFLSLSRSIVFLPFFLFGYYFTPENKKQVNKLNYALTVCLFIAVSVAAVIVYSDLSFLFGCFSYSSEIYVNAGYTVFGGMLLRIHTYLTAFIMCILFIRLVNGKQYFFSKFGKYTITIFLLHSSVKLIVKYFIEYFEKLDPYLVYIIMIFLSVICLYLFGNKLINYLYDFVISTTGRIIINKKEDN